MGRNSVAYMKPSINIGEGILTVLQIPAYSIKSANLLRKEQASMVYVISNNGQPLMPTERHGKVRRLLKEGKAKVVKRCPFTIQLLYETDSEVQKVNLGIDAGSKTIGVSATTEIKVLYESEVTLRNDIVDLLSSRREFRRARRNRKTRYRKPRFDNRDRGEKWLAPSVRNKIETHLKAVPICIRSFR